MVRAIVRVRVRVMVRVWVRVRVRVRLGDAVIRNAVGRKVGNLKNVYCLAFHPYVLACLNINNQDYFKILQSWPNLILFLASQMIYTNISNH